MWPPPREGDLVVLECEVVWHSCCSCCSNVLQVLNVNQDSIVGGAFRNHFALLWDTIQLFLRKFSLASPEFLPPSVQQSKFGLERCHSESLRRFSELSDISSCNIPRIRRSDGISALRQGGGIAKICSKDLYTSCSTQLRCCRSIE